MHILYSVQTRTHPGKVRENNEDALSTVLDWQSRLGLTDEILQQRGHLFAVADGMGGHAAGEVASQMAIEMLFTHYYTDEWENPRATLAAAILAANRAIWEKAEANVRMSGMGTTLVAALYLPERWLIANVGDSRAYLFRAQRLKQISKDHSWVAEQVKSGILSEKEAAHHPFRNVITRSLGNEPEVSPDFFELDAQPRDIVLLCSDGLSNMVSEKEMRAILKAYALDEAAERLLELPLERGAPDNVSFDLIQLVANKQRRSRSFIPWLALISAILIIGGFVYWSFTRNDAAQLAVTQIAPVTPLATFTPVMTPTLTPAPDFTTSSPLKLAIQPALPDPLGAIGMREAVVFATPTHQSDALIFVSGAATIEAITEDNAYDLLTVVMENGESFSATLDRAHYVWRDPPPTGGRLALVGAMGEAGPAQDGQSLKPLLVLAPFSDRKQFAVLWMADDTAVQVFLDRFGLQDKFISLPDSYIIQVQQ